MVSWGIVGQPKKKKSKDSNRVVWRALPAVPGGHDNILDENGAAILQENEEPLYETP